MRILVLILAVGFFFSGCAQMKSWLPSGPQKKSREAASPQAPIFTPATYDAGIIARVNPNGRFVVMTFPLGGVPGIDRRLNVYRNGLKVGEVKVTGPQRDHNTVADIISGEARVNDEVRLD